MGGSGLTFVSLFVILLLLCFPLGLFLLFLGWRGKYHGTFPSCGNCGFDVTGIPSDNPSKCPECGSGLAGKTKIGRHRRRFVPLIAGSVLLLISFTAFSIMLLRML